MKHDFENFPELTNSQLTEFYFESPHRQILEDFTAEVVKVHDGDTVSVRWSERDFDFPVRFLTIAAPELSEDGGKESQQFMEDLLLGHTVDFIIDKNNRVEKWGRLLARPVLFGMDAGEMSIQAGQSVPFESINDGKILSQIPRLEKWL